MITMFCREPLRLLDKAAEGVLSTFHAHEVEIIRNAEIKLSKEELDELKELE